MTVGVVSGLLFSVASLFPTGAMNGENVTRYQPIKMAAMEGLFKTQEGAPMAIIGMPDTERARADGPDLRPARAELPRLRRLPRQGRRASTTTRRISSRRSSSVYYAYHIMVGLGTIFIAVMATAAFLLWRGRLFGRAGSCGF